jgi:uncharacterized iron-regulated membrane protein
MSLTGVLLTYERQILAWSARGYVQSEPPPNSRPLTVAELVEAVKRHRGGANSHENLTLTLRSDSRMPAEVRIGRANLLYVDTYTGKVSDANSSSTRAFFQKMVAWHRWLGVKGPGRNTARAITGACNLAFLVLIVTGAYLWLPRTWSWLALRPILWFRSGLPGKARDFNWHNVFGIWALAPLLFVVLTALPISYSWANDLLYRITGSEPPPPPTGGRPGSRNNEARIAVPANLNKLWNRAAMHVPGWTSISGSVAVPPGQPVTFTIDTGEGGQPQKRSTLALDPSTGAVVRSENFGDLSPGRRLRMWSRFVHTGEYYGLAGQTVAGVGSAAGVMLVWTGVSLALRRFAAWRARRKRRSLPVEEPQPVDVHQA